MAHQPIKDTPTLYGEDAKIKEICNAFARIEKAKLKPITIICTVCGNVVSDNVDTSVVEYQLAKLVVTSSNLAPFKILL